MTDADDTALIECEVGESITLSATVKDSEGTPMTGADVVARVLPRGATAVELDPVTDDGGGVYSASYTPALPGTHYVRFEATKTGKTGVAESFISARPTRFEVTP